MTFRTAGIHHVTGIASDPQRNLDFYAGILGLRLVKRTVNFDDPTTYHFYFGDEQGSPGSILTFFPWPDARRGRQGGGQVAVTSFAILPSSVGFWIERLIKKQVQFEQPAARYEDSWVSLSPIQPRILAPVGQEQVCPPSTLSAAFIRSLSGSMPTSSPGNF